MFNQHRNPSNGYQNIDNNKNNFNLKNLQTKDWNSLRNQTDWVEFDAKKASDEYIAKHQVTNEPSELNDIWKNENNVTIYGNNCPLPITNFNMLTMVPDHIRDKLLSQGFQAPTTIQAQSWPILFQMRDLVGIAKTGSGKTLAYVVPAITHILSQPPLKPGDGPIGLILAPTRELAKQIEAEIKKIIPNFLRCCCVYGGSPKGPQLNLLRYGCHLLVATPGRLIDFLNIGRVNLLRCTYLVLDEADRMLDMGFEPQVRNICSQIRPERQTLMFSATWPVEIQSLASSFQKDYIRIHIGSTELMANPDVTQKILHVADDKKLSELRNLLTQNDNIRVLIFCKTKKTADFLEQRLKYFGFSAMAIHGNKEQRQREYIMDKFRKENRLKLVATDVVARGLDIKDLEMVVNYDFPMMIDDYVHRIGRTGRAGEKGAAYTFITKNEEQLSYAMRQDLIKILRNAKQDVPEFLLQWTENQRQNGKRGREGFRQFNRIPRLNTQGNYNNYNNYNNNFNTGHNQNFSTPIFANNPQQSSNYIRFDNQ